MPLAYRLSRIFRNFVLSHCKRERKKRIYRKRIPYGMQNFEDMIERDCYYVDKTPFIEDIEDSNKYFFFIRPRRFGKSLTVSMLENYYDINKKDKFDEIFGWQALYW